LAGSGVQQTRNCHSEKTVEVVRNHDGGTRPAPGDAGPKEPALRSQPPEWTSGRYIGGRAQNPMRGGTNERRFQRSPERSEGEAKAMKVAIRGFGCGRRT
jgi:hypothetical protein